VNPTIGSLTSGGEKNSQNTVLFKLLPTPSAVVWQWRENLLSGQSEEYSTFAFFNSIKENTFFEKLPTLCNTYDFGSVPRDQTGTFREAEIAQSRSHPFW